MGQAELTPEREDARLERNKYEAMKAFCHRYGTAPDGAFFAIALEDHGWDVDDWAWFSEYESEKKPNHRRRRRASSRNTDRAANG